MRPLASATVLVFIGLCRALSGAPAAAAEPSAATTTPVLTYSVVEAKTGKALHTLRGWTEAVDGAPDRIVAVSTITFPTGNAVQIRVTFTHDQPPHCLASDAVVTDAAGTVVARGHEEFVQEAFPFLSQAVPPNTYPPLAPLGYVLTRLGLGKSERASFHFILMGTSLLKMDLWVDGRELVRVPAGEFDCYRVSMRVNPASLFPNLPAFLQGFVRLFIPTHTIWLTASEPQTLVKYTGQMGPPGAPELLIQLMSSGTAAP
jgi:hypothetical protein